MTTTEQITERKNKPNREYLGGLGVGLASCGAVGTLAKFFAPSFVLTVLAVFSLLGLLFVVLAVRGKNDNTKARRTVPINHVIILFYINFQKYNCFDSFPRLNATKIKN